MKQFLDFLPLVVFFAFYKLYDIYAATTALIVATAVVLIYSWVRYRKVEKMALITFVLVVMLFRPAQQLEVISTGLLALGIICTVPIMSRWKKLVLWQKLPLQNTR
jgi:hypothetical protein